LSLDEKARIVDSARNARLARREAPTRTSSGLTIAARPEPSFPRPETLPDHPQLFWTGAMADRQGRLWLRRASDPANVYHVYDRTGAALVSVRIPVGATLLSVGAMGGYVAIPASGGMAFRVARIALP
jgi:hypothetical protein